MSFLPGSGAGAQGHCLVPTQEGQLPPHQSEAFRSTFELKSGSQLLGFAHKAPDDKRLRPSFDSEKRTWRYQSARELDEGWGIPPKHSDRVSIFLLEINVAGARSPRAGWLGLGITRQSRPPWSPDPPRSESTEVLG